MTQIYWQPHDEKCEQCGRVFRQASPAQRFCCPACRIENHSHVYVCRICGKSFRRAYATASNVPITCSFSCSGRLKSNLKKERKAAASAVIVQTGRKRRVGRKAAFTAADVMGLSGDKAARVVDAILRGEVVYSLSARRTA